MINDRAGNIEQDFISRSTAFSFGEKKRWLAVAVVQAAVMAANLSQND